MAWLVVGFIVIVAAGVILFLTTRLRAKRNEAAPRQLKEEGRAPSSDAAAPERSSGRGSAARWLSSLVKAEDDDRTTRGGPGSK